MITRIDKLVKEYREKEEDCQTIISSYEDKRRQLRTDRNKNQDEIDYINNQISIKEAQKQAYAQARVDIESLLL